MTINGSMKISSTGLKMLATLEGVELAVYLDEAGYPTIGIGHLLTRSELRSGKIILTNTDVLDYRYRKLTLPEAHSLLRSDLDRYEACVRCNTDSQLAQHWFDALVMFTFNVGRTAFKNSTLLRRVNALRFDDVPDEMRRWVYTGGKKSTGLRNRREREIALFWNATYYTG